METVEFSTKRSNIKRKRRGILIGKYLAIVPTIYGISSVNQRHKIYNIKTGLPLLNCNFRTRNDAVEFATWIDSIFSKYFIIWDKYPNIDVIAWCKWSVPMGVRIYLMMEMLDKQEIVTLQDIKAIFERASYEIWKWTRKRNIG